MDSIIFLSLAVFSWRHFNKKNQVNVITVNENLDKFRLRCTYLVHMKTFILFLKRATASAATFEFKFEGLALAYVTRPTQ